MSQAGSFASDAFEDVVDERVHDAHGFAGDTSVRVNLFQHLIHVDCIAFLSRLSPFLVTSGGLSLTSFLLAFLSLQLLVPFSLNRVRLESNDNAM